MERYQLDNIRNTVTQFKHKLKMSHCPLYSQRWNAYIILGASTFKAFARLSPATQVFSTNMHNFHQTACGRVEPTYHALRIRSLRKCFILPACRCVTNRKFCTVPNRDNPAHPSLCTCISTISTTTFRIRTKAQTKYRKRAIVNAFL